MSLTVDGFWKAGFWSTTFWADGFWFEGTPTPTPTPVVQGRGSWDKLKGKKKKPKVLKFSEFESRDALAQALKAEIQPKTIIVDPQPPLGENDDDDIILAALSKILH
jgi:hypothetical protein